MRGILILLSISVAYGGVIKNDCVNTVNVRGVYYDLEVLHENIDRPYLLAVDHSTNIVYFSYSNGTEQDDNSITARVNLNTKEFKNILGVNNGFAQTVDQETHTIYIGGSDGIYKYDYGNDKADKFFTEKEANIWTLYFKDVLYLSVFPLQFLYTLENGQKTRFKELEDTKVDHFAIDNNNTIFFTNATGLYSQEKGTKNAVLYQEFQTASVRALTTDKNGEVYVCLAEGIYAVNKNETKLDQLFNVDDAFGLAFDNDNNIVYADSKRLVRLNPNGRQFVNCSLF